VEAEAAVAASQGSGVVMSPTESKHPRRAVRYPAYIDLGPDRPLRACTLCNVAEDGAELTVANADTLPKYFTLALSIDGAAQRRCRMVWKVDLQIGVEFLRTPKRNYLHSALHPARRDREVDGAPTAPADDATAAPHGPKTLSQV
jgi:hypothetical protein